MNPLKPALSIALLSLTALPSLAATDALVKEEYPSKISYACTVEKDFQSVLPVEFLVEIDALVPGHDAKGVASLRVDATHGVDAKADLDGKTVGRVFTGDAVYTLSVLLTEDLLDKDAAVSGRAIVLGSAETAPVRFQFSPSQPAAGLTAANPDMRVFVADKGPTFPLCRRK